MNTINTIMLMKAVMLLLVPVKLCVLQSWCYVWYCEYAELKGTASIVCSIVMLSDLLSSSILASRSRGCSSSLTYLDSDLEHQLYNILCIGESDSIEITYCVPEH